MAIFSDIPWVRAAVSEKADGNMRIAPDTPAEARAEREERRRAFLAGHGMPGSLVTPYLVHGGRAAPIRDASLPYLPDTDALLTDVPGIAIGVTVADCMPVFLADTAHRAVAVVHAGWRGVLAGVLSNAVAAMREAFGTAPGALRAAVGPCIGSCHFEVGREVYGRFPKEVRVSDGLRRFIDLPGACNNALLALGVPHRAIAIDGSCTYCEATRYFSFRREKGTEPDAMLAAIATVPA